METVWFVLISLMLAVYVALDGFDFGVGILHLFVAKNDIERRTTLAAIGPVWDGNEVWLLALAILASLVSVFAQMRRKQELGAFLASVGFLLSMLGATAAGLYPNLLTSSVSRAYDLHIGNAAAETEGLRTSLLWWTLAMALAVGYFITLFRSFRGKVTVESDGHGY